MKQRYLFLTKGLCLLIKNSAITISLLLLFAFASSTQANVLSYDSVIEDGIDGADGLLGVWHSTISPDGKHLYTAGFEEAKIGVYARDTEGNLSFIEIQENGVNGVAGLAGVGFIYISPDGAYLYTAAWDDDAVTVFSRDATTGKLTLIEVHIDAVNGVSGINRATSIAMSQDGMNIYVTGGVSNAVATFDRDPATGKLIYNRRFVHSRLSSARSVIISPDDLHVYVAATFFGSIMVFDRNMATGVLTLNEIIENGVNGVDGLGGIWWLTMSDDGKFIYAAGTNDDAIAMFSRDLTTGKLTYITMYKDGVDGISNLNGVSSIVLVSIPNGTTQNSAKNSTKNAQGKMGNDNYLLATSISDGLSLFLLDSVTGFLTLLEIYTHDPLGTINRLKFASSMAVAGRNVYVTASQSHALSTWSFIDTTTPDEPPQDDSNANDRFAAKVRDPINTFNGELFTQKPRELNLGGPMPLYFQRYYASYLRRSFIVGDLGSNWRHNFDARLFQLATGNQYKYVSHDGRVTEFLQNSVSGVWEQQTNLDTPYQITIVTGQDTIIYDPEIDRIYTFDFTTSSTIIGKLIKIEDGKGNTHGITYNLVNAQIQTVSDGLGRTLNFTYNNDAVPKISVVDNGTRSISFQYTDPIDTEYLTIATDARLGATTYVYKDTNTVADHGLMTAMTRPAGNTPFTQTFFDTNTPLSSGKVSTQTDANGNTFTLDYNSLVTTITDPVGNSRVHTHSATGELINSQDQVGNSVVIGSDATGRRNAVTDRMGDLTSFSFDAASGLKDGTTHADGSSESLTITPRVNGTTTQYDLTNIIDRDGTTRSFNYDASGNLISSTDQLGNTTSTTFNNKGQWLTSTNKAGATTTRTFNADGTLATRTDASGNMTAINYDAQKRPVQITSADGSVSTVSYDNNDNLLSATDAKGNTFTFTYDANNNLASITDGSGNVTNLTYTGNDRLAQVKDALNNTVSTTYDGLGRVNSTTDANGNTRTLNYNSRNHLSSIVDALGNTSSQNFDLEGVLTSFIDPLGNTTTFSSDKMGRATGIASALGSNTGIIYDQMGRVISTTDPLNNKTDFSYDSRGLLTNISLPGGTVNASYNRNNLGQITSITDPGGNDWQYDRDNQGRYTGRTDPLGNTTSVSYDNRNRPQLVTFPGGLGALTIGHDQVGNVTSQTYSDGLTLNYSYDNNNRLLNANGITLVRDANGRIINSNGIEMTRDANGLITSITYAPSKVVTYAYDANNRISQITDWVGGVTTFSYDAVGNQIGITRANGISTVKTYDNDNRLIGITENSPAAVNSNGTTNDAARKKAEISSIGLVLDDNGQTISMTSNVPLFASAANLSSNNQTTDAASQLNGPSYDPKGNTTLEANVSYQWEDDSSLKSFTTSAGTTSFINDAKGRHTSRIFNGQAFQYKWNYGFARPVINIEQEDGVDFVYNIFTPGGIPVSRINASDNACHFYHYDAFGNTSFITDNTGEIIASYAYSPFGIVTNSTGSLTNHRTWKAQSGALDEGDGMFIIGTRYYNAITGRYISRDPKVHIDPQKSTPYQLRAFNPLQNIIDNSFSLDLYGENTNEFSGDDNSGDSFGLNFNGLGVSHGGMVSIDPPGINLDNTPSHREAAEEGSLKQPGSITSVIGQLSMFQVKQIDNRISIIRNKPAKDTSSEIPIEGGFFAAFFAALETKNAKQQVRKLRKLKFELRSALSGVEISGGIANPKFEALLSIEDVKEFEAKFKKLVDADEFLFDFRFF